VDFPLRSLKTLHLYDCTLDLDEADFEAVRDEIKSHNVKITLEASVDLASVEMDISDADLEVFRPEWEFWRSVEPGVTLVDLFGHLGEYCARVRGRAR
jgi:hypothetical protein